MSFEFIYMVDYCNQAEYATDYTKDPDLTKPDLTRPEYATDYITKKIV